MLAAITAVVHLTVRGGNRVGAIVGNGSDSYRIPALAGRNHAPAPGPAHRGHPPRRERRAART